MKKVDRSILRDFLDKNGCKTTENVMSELEPFYQIAEQGNFELILPEEIDTEKMKVAIQLATDKHVERIVFISINNPFPKPEWMTEDVYKNSLRDSLGDSFWNSLRDSLGDSLRDSLGDSLRDSFWNSLWNSLGDSFWNSLRDSLGDSFWNSLRDSLRDSLGDSLRDSLRVSLYFFVGFSLANKDKEVSRIKPFLPLCSKCLILGEKKDEPGTWLVLVK